MITIRERSNALSLSVRTGVATLKPGMIVKLAQGTNSGDQPTIVKASTADIQDAKIQKFIVQNFPTDSLVVDFTIDPGTQVLTALDDTIAQGTQVNVYMGVIEVAYDTASLPAGVLALRESAEVGFSGVTNLPTDATDAATNGAVMGFLYRIDGPEFTFVFKL